MTFMLFTTVYAHAKQEYSMWRTIGGRDSRWSVSRKLSFVIPLSITSLTQYIKHNLTFKSLYNAYAKHRRNKSIESRVLVKSDNLIQVRNRSHPADVE